MIAAAMLALTAGATLIAPECPIDRAVYRLQADPNFTAGFARRDPRLNSPSDLAFWLKTPKRTYWFALASPNGYGGTYISPGPDPAAETAAMEAEPDDEDATAEQTVSIELDVFDARLRALPRPPVSSDPAPARLFARGLGPALWYDAVGLAGGDPGAEPESLPISMFEPAGCDAAPGRRTK
jgi:hypothetical protein